MRGVRSLSGLAGPNASLKDVGGGGYVPPFVRDSAVVSGRIDTFDFTTLDIRAGDIVFVWGTELDQSTTSGSDTLGLRVSTASGQLMDFQRRGMSLQSFDFGGTTPGNSFLAHHNALGTEDWSTVVFATGIFTQAGMIFVIGGGSGGFRFTKSSGTSAQNPVAVPCPEDALLLGLFARREASMVTGSETPPAGFTIIQETEQLSGSFRDYRMTAAIGTADVNDDTIGAWGSYSGDHHAHNVAFF